MKVFDVNPYVQAGTALLLPMILKSIKIDEHKVSLVDFNTVVSDAINETLITDKEDKVLKKQWAGFKAGLGNVSTESEVKAKIEAYAHNLPSVQSFYRSLTVAWVSSFQQTAMDEFLQRDAAGRIDVEIGYDPPDGALGRSNFRFDIDKVTVHNATLPSGTNEALKKSFESNFVPEQASQNNNHKKHYMHLFDLPFPVHVAFSCNFHIREMYDFYSTGVWKNGVWTQTSGESVIYDAWRSSKYFEALTIDKLSS